MLQDKNFITESIRKLKDYKAKIFKLLPSELSDFLKIKNTFMSSGVILSDDMLNRPLNDIVEYVTATLQVTAEKNNNVQKIAPNIATKELINVDVDIFEQERSEIRRQLFNGDIIVKIMQTGRSFNVSWNVKMTTCKINVPSTWAIEADQSLLLDLYSKSFHASPDQIATNAINNLSPLANIINDLLSRHSDYVVIKKIVSIELECNNTTLMKGINKHKMRQLISRGLSKNTAAIIISLYAQIINKTYTRQDIVDILGFRTRLINELDKLLAK